VVFGGFEQRMIDYAPLKRIATPAEVSQGVLYLASFAARSVTGAALSIDGCSTAGR
jgi:NAD(P)-dependent dehydrogenase (short-subunit alcohol dehydrogenase family)